MVRELVVYTAAVDVKLLSAVFYGYGGAFYMPSGITVAPRAVPLKLLIFKL